MLREFLKAEITLVPRRHTNLYLEICCLMITFLAQIHQLTNLTKKECRVMQSAVNLQKQGVEDSKLECQGDAGLQLSNIKSVLFAKHIMNKYFVYVLISI